MMPVDIQAQYMDLKVVITGQVGYVEISIQEVAEDVVINIRNTAETAIYVRTESGVAINVKTESEVVLNIWTPSGKWVTASEPVSSFIATGYQTIAAGTEVELISVGPGVRGRLMSLGIMATYSVSGGTSYHNIIPYVEIRIYIDGSPTPISFSLDDLDALSGLVLERTRHEGLYHPSYTVLYGLNPVGGLIYSGNDADGIPQEAGGYLNMPIEFFDSISIRVYNDSAYNISARLAAIIGEYP